MILSYENYATPAGFHSARSSYNRPKLESTHNLSGALDTARGCTVNREFPWISNKSLIMPLWLSSIIHPISENQKRSLCCAIWKQTAMAESLNCHFFPQPLHSYRKLTGCGAPQVSWYWCSTSLGSFFVLSWDWYSGLTFTTGTCHHRGVWMQVLAIQRPSFKPLSYLAIPLCHSCVFSTYPKVDCEHICELGYELQHHARSLEDYHLQASSSPEVSDKSFYRKRLSCLSLPWLRRGNT